MTLVDVIILSLALIAGVSGWRNGLAVALLSFVGVLGGAVLGVKLAPLIASGVESAGTRVIISIVVVVMLVALGETTGVYLGRHIRDRIPGGTSLTVDSAFGAVLQALTVLLAAWLIAVPLTSVSLPGLAAAVKGSQVLQAVDGVMPKTAERLPQALRELLKDNDLDFPTILDPFAQTPIAAVGEPNTALTRSAIVAQVHDSIFKVRGRAPSCSRALEGTGFVVAPQLVMTNAHVVAGTSETSIEVGRRQLPARVVVYDPNVDVAVLRVPDLDAQVMRFVSDAAGRGDDAIILGYPLDGPYNPQAAKVRQRIPLTGPNIYDNRTVTRDVYTVRGVVRSGNSGGPLIAPSGEVIGVVFGAAVDDRQTGFVLSAEQVRPAFEAAQERTRPVDTGSCSS